MSNESWFVNDRIVLDLGLSQLDPKMNEADTFDLIKVTTDSVYGLPAHGGVGGKGKEDSGGEGDKGPQVRGS